jgi:hypothetical protein
VIGKFPDSNIEQNPQIVTAIRPFRTLLIGAIGVGIVSLVVSSADLQGTIQMGVFALPPAAIALLFLLAFANRFIRKINPNWTLSTPELAVIFVMMLFSALISGRGLMERIFPMQVGINYFAPKEHWDKLYFPYFKQFMVPWDLKSTPPSQIVSWYYEGLPGGMSIPWSAWATSTLYWLALVAAVFFAFLCMSIILRRQWVENERLPFPLVQLPLEIMRGQGEFLNNRWFWYGVALPVALFTLNGLHRNFPWIPEIPLRFDLASAFNQPQLQGRMSYTTILLTLSGLGFFFLIPTELLFSFWFFYLFGKVQEIISLYMGLDISANHAAAGAIIKWECSGGFFAMSIYILFLARHHLKNVVSCAFGRIKDYDSQEMFSYRVAFWGFVGALVFIVFWCSLIGMTWWVTLSIYGIYLLVQGLVMARATAEGGLWCTEACFTPSDILTMEKYSILGAQNLALTPFTDRLFTRDLRGIPITGLMDAHKIGDDVALKRKTLLRMLGFGLILTLIIGTFIHLWFPYTFGAGNLYKYDFQGENIRFFRQNAPFMSGGQSAPIPWVRPVFFVIGLVVTGVMAFFRTRFPWFPFHPLGFAMSATWGVVCFWFVMLIAWLIKVPVLRYGGMPMYRKMRPFFLGLIFGEFMMAVLWTLLRLIWRIETPVFPWP